MKNLIALALAFATLALIALRVFAADQNIPVGPQSDPNAPVQLNLYCDHSPTPHCSEPHVEVANKVAPQHYLPLCLTAANTPLPLPTVSGTPTAQFCKVCLDANTPDQDYAAAGQMVDAVTGVKLSMVTGFKLAPGGCTDRLPAYDGTCTAYGLVSPSAGATPACGTGVQQ